MLCIGMPNEHVRSGAGEPTVKSIKIAWMHE